MTKAGWEENNVSRELPQHKSWNNDRGKNKWRHVLPTMKPGEIHFNDDRYTGNLTEYIPDPNDSR